jgi:hypothetical protein
MRKPKDLIDWLLIAVVVLCAWRLMGDGVAGPQSIRAVVVYESADATAYPAETVLALRSQAVLDYMASKGYPYHIADQHSPPTEGKALPEWVAASMAEASEETLPVLVIRSEGGKQLHVGPVTTADDLLATLQRFGGQ